MMCECVLAFATFQAFRTYYFSTSVSSSSSSSSCFLAEHMNFYLIHVYLSRILNPTLLRGNPKWYIYYQGFLTSCHPSSPDPIPLLPPAQTILVIVHSWPLKWMFHAPVLTCAKHFFWWFFDEPPIQKSSPSPTKTEWLHPNQNGREGRSEGYHTPHNNSHSVKCN